MSNQKEINDCLDIILRNEKLLNYLYQFNKKTKNKNCKGKMIRMERKNIKTMKAKLILLGTSYESAMQQYRLTVQLSARQAVITTTYTQRYGSINTPSARGKTGIA